MRAIPTCGHCATEIQEVAALLAVYFIGVLSAVLKVSYYYG